MSERQLYSFWIDREHLEALKGIRERDGILPSEQIRRALTDWIRKKRIGVVASRKPAVRRKPAIKGKG